MMINGETQLIGLIGWPVAHSLSPVMHNAAAEELGLNWTYVPLPVRPEELETALDGLAALGFRGVNVTIPHKQAVMPYLDTLDDAVRVIGAVNTIVIERLGIGNWRLRGYNTDWVGFKADLDSKGVDVMGRDCLVLGAGGSARAAVYALGQAGGRVQVLARRPEQAQTLVHDLQAIFPGRLSGGSLTDLGECAAACDAPLIVNTTPLGMEPSVGGSPWPETVTFPAGAFVYDLVYHPSQTRLLHQAASAGCEVANGLGMLARQAAEAFALWTGQQPDVNIMLETIESAVEQRSGVGYNAGVGKI